jgi:hypothetical protein
MLGTVVILYFAISRKRAERIELIKRGVNPEKYDIKLPGKLGLPWGVVFLALGLGPLIAMLVTGDAFSGHSTDELGLSLAGIIGGVGLIIYWRMTADERERALKIKEELMLREGKDFDPNGVNLEK